MNQSIQRSQVTSPITRIIVIEKVAQKCQLIIGTFDKMNEALNEIEKRAPLSVPLLKSIEDALTV
jgi:hypothetical protein